jgi:hypothetical protein
MPTQIVLLRWSWLGNEPIFFRLGFPLFLFILAREANLHCERSTLDGRLSSLFVAHDRDGDGNLDFEEYFAMIKKLRNDQKDSISLRQVAWCRACLRGHSVLTYLQMGRGRSQESGIDR